MWSGHETEQRVSNSMNTSSHRIDQHGHESGERMEYNPTLPTCQIQPVLSELSLWLKSFPFYEREKEPNVIFGRRGWSIMIDDLHDVFVEHKSIIAISDKYSIYYTRRIRENCNIKHKPLLNMVPKYAPLNSVKCLLLHDFETITCILKITVKNWKSLPRQDNDIGNVGNNSKDTDRDRKVTMNW